MNLLPPGPNAPTPLRWLGILVDTAIVVLGAALVVVVFGNVVLHAFGKDIAWTTEFGELVMVWTTFLGVAAAVQRNSHMAVSELIDLVPEPRPRLLVDCVLQLAVAGLLLLLIWKGGVAANAGWGSEMSVTGWPVAVQYLSLPVSSAIAMVFVIWDLFQIGRGKPRQQRYAVNGVKTS
jgi:TRAP-type C4-dicarboxylate transport system permease small subunit